MVKGSFFSRFLSRNAKKTSTSHNKSRGISSSDVSSPSSPPSCSLSLTSTKKKEYATEPNSKTSKQHILSLLKCSNSETCDGINLSTDIPEQQIPLYCLRLYVATVQKLKRHRPASMEKQRAVYNLLSCLVIQQELDRFEPEFEYLGRKPRKTRYISTLLDTPVESIAPYQHPVLEASKRKPFVETLDIIIPSSSTHTSTTLGTSSSSMPSPIALTRSPSTFSPDESSPHAASFPSFMPYKQKRRNLSDPLLPRIPTCPHIRSSRSDSCLFSLTSNEEDEDNIPLAILRTRKSDGRSRKKG
ncbi:hypothetical protein BC941DRAFT_467504 [Chlamydoabsidia padenii]|nr:hypothetical protein BC941DRAFT_467504 [Chlamydoabsidia padenii]